MNANVKEPLYVGDCILDVTEIPEPIMRDVKAGLYRLAPFVVRENKKKNKLEKMPAFCKEAGWDGKGWKGVTDFQKYATADMKELQEMLDACKDDVFLLAVGDKVHFVEADMHEGQNGLAVFNQWDTEYGYTSTFTIQTPTNCGQSRTYSNPSGTWAGETTLKNKPDGYNGIEALTWRIIWGKGYSILDDSPVAYRPDYLYGITEVPIEPIPDDVVKQSEDYDMTPEEEKKALEWCMEHIDRRRADNFGDIQGNDGQWNGVMQVVSTTQDESVGRWAAHEFSSNSNNYDKDDVDKFFDVTRRKSLKLIAEGKPVKRIPTLIYWLKKDGHEYGGITPMYNPTVSKKQRESRDKIWTVGELLTTEFPEPKWAVPGLFPVGLIILGGRPKLGKSIFSLQLAVSVATGGVFLGKSIPQGKVLYLALEDYAKRLQDRLRKMGATDTPNLHIRLFYETLHTGGLNDLMIDIEREKYTLVIVDTQYKAFSGLDQSKPEKIGPYMEQIQSMSIHNDFATIIVDHTRKSSALGADPIDDIISSTVKAGTADAVFALYREQGKEGAVLMGRGRDMEEVSMKMKLDPYTLIWKFDGDTNDALTMSQKWQDIFDLVEELGPIGLTRLANIMHTDVSNLRKDLVAMTSCIPPILVRQEDKKYVVHESRRPEPHEVRRAPFDDDDSDDEL